MEWLSVWSVINHLKCKSVGLSDFKIFHLKNQDNKNHYQIEKYAADTNFSGGESRLKHSHLLNSLSKKRRKTQFDGHFEGIRDPHKQQILNSVNC